MEDILKDRTDAGKRLAVLLRRYKDKPGCMVLALPRGGVPVACEIAEALNLPLDVCIVKKLVRKVGVGCERELALGAVASGGLVVLNEDVLQEWGIKKRSLEAEIERELKELARRERVYRDQRPFPSVVGRTVILVDDGVATGATLKAGTQALRAQAPERIVAAVGVAPPSAAYWLGRAADEVVTVLQPEPFGAISQWYEQFPQVTDEQVRTQLANARRNPRAQRTAAG